MLRNVARTVRRGPDGTPNRIAEGITEATLRDVDRPVAHAS